MLNETIIKVKAETSTIVVEITHIKADTNISMRSNLLKANILLHNEINFSLIIILYAKSF